MSALLEGGASSEEGGSFKRVVHKQADERKKRACDDDTLHGVLGLFILLIPASTNLALVKQLALEWADIEPVVRAVVLLSNCATIVLTVLAIKCDWIGERETGGGDRLLYFTSGAVEARVLTEGLIIDTHRACCATGPKTSLASVKRAVDGSLSARVKEALESKWLENAELLPGMLQESRRKVMRARALAAVLWALMAATIVALYA